MGNHPQRAGIIKFEAGNMRFFMAKDDSFCHELAEIISSDLDWDLEDKSVVYQQSRAWFSNWNTPVVVLDGLCGALE